MTSLVGQERPREALLAAAASGSLHHAWLLAGPKGVGKAGFARTAAGHLLARAAGERVGDALDLAASSRTRALLDAGSHPDFRVLERLPRDRKAEAAEKRDADLARNISVDQVRGLLAMFATTPALSPRRVVVIDSIDDLERSAANALLKSLEEPPAGTVFLLVSHAPGRLLPTIRSRCRLLRFDPLDEESMARVLRAALPDAGEEELASLARAGAGSPGRALGYAGLSVAALDKALGEIARDGDPTNARRLRLAQELGAKAALPRFELFLERAPAFLAEAAAQRGGAPLRVALDAYDEARAIAGSVRELSLDPQATVFELAGLVARLAAPAGAR